MPLKIIATMCLLLLLAGCDRAEEGEWESLMEGLPSRLVVVFQKGVESGEVYSYLQEHTCSQSPNSESGFEHRPEIGAVVKIRLQGHEACEIGFWPMVTAEQIAAIREEMAASDLVYRVYENVDPEKIRLE